MLTEEQIFKTILTGCKKAIKQNEIPVCAIVVDENNSIVSKAINRTKMDVLGHAEIRAIKRAAKKLKSRYLYNCKIYVNLEPCIMCAFACVLSRISEIVYVLRDQKFGGVYSLYQIPIDIRLNHRIIVRKASYFEEEFKELLRKFFKNSNL
ncbi:MAG: nucleoside deaminase [candidate division WOR-3 bacterium]|nr:nucleoside deaminase [candidate division WOR-3 bacterium]